MLLALILVFACVFTMAACGNKDKDEEGEPTPPPVTPTDHEHTYTESVTAPTCTADGFTTYTCTCGDTYTDDTVAATGHSYTSAVATYPTVDTAGSRTLTCSNCGDRKSEPIEALSASVPAIADVLVAIIGEAQYTLSAAEDSNVVYVREYSDYTAAGVDGNKQFIIFELAEATLSGKDGELYGHIKLEMSHYEADVNDTVSPDDIVYDASAEETAALYLYVNGDDISLELVNPDGTTDTNEASLDEMFYTALGSMFGVDADAMIALSYVAGQLGDLAPLAEAIFEAITTADIPTISEEYVAGLGELFSLVGANIIATETAGDNVTYSVNLAALSPLLEEIEGKTIVEYLAEVYGEDIAAELFNFIKALPDKTIREIADTAMTFAEEAGVTVADVFTTVEVFLYNAGGVEISIYELIEENAELTLGEILIEAQGGTITPDELKTQIDSVIEMANAATFDQLIAAVAPEASIEELKAMIEALGDAITAEITVNSTTGALVSFELSYADMSVTGEVETDGTVNITADLGAASITAELGAEEGEITLQAEGDIVTLAYSSTGITITGIDDAVGEILNGSVTVTENAEYTYISANLEFDGDDYLDFSATIESGVLVFAGADIRGYTTEYDQVYNPDTEMWEDRSTTTFGTLVSFNYQAGGVSELLVITIEDVTFRISHRVESGYDIIDGEAIVDDETEAEFYLEFADGYIYYEIGDGTYVFFCAGIDVDTTTGEINGIIYEINQPTYDDDTGEINGIEEIFAFEYQAADGTDPAWIGIAINGVALEAELVEGGITVDLAIEGEDLGDISIITEAGVTTLDAYIAIDGDVLVDGTVAIGAGELDVDIDKLVVGIDDRYSYDSYYDEYLDEWIESETFLYTVIETIALDFAIEFTVE